MNATVAAARTAAAQAIIEARASRTGTRANESAFLTFRRAAQINNGAYALAYRDRDEFTVSARTIAGHLLTQRADRATIYAW